MLSDPECIRDAYFGPLFICFFVVLCNQRSWMKWILKCVKINIVYFEIAVKYIYLFMLNMNLSHQT